MDESELRHLGRDSLFVLADLRLDGSNEEHRIKVRNLSAGGLMGEAPLRVVRGAAIAVNLRNIGWVEGSIAWVQDSRFGIEFREDIDPKVARAPQVTSEQSLRFARPPLGDHTGAGVLRKI
jgi:PilZ domain